MAEGGTESTDTRQPMRTLLSDKRVNGFSPLNILYLEYSDANYVPDNVISIGFCSGDHLDVLLRDPADLTHASRPSVRTSASDLDPTGPSPPHFIYTTSNSSSKDQDQGYEHRKRIN